MKEPWKRTPWYGILFLGSLLLFMARCQGTPGPSQDNSPLTAATRQVPELPTMTGSAMDSSLDLPPTATPEARMPTAGLGAETPAATPSLPPAASPAPTSSPPASPTPTRPPAYGVEMYQISEARGLAWAPAAGVYWIRRNGLEWSKVEPAPGERRWKAVDKLETELQAAYDADLQTILVVRRAPDWAQKVPGFSCGPVAPDALDALAQFMADAVERYKDPPYGVKYWEIGNEPDVDPSFVVPNSPYGCWGDQEDPFYGGEYYAQMLQAVYPAIKAADPEAQVLIGGLLLASDPAVDESPNPQGHFLEGILKGGGGEYFDIVSFHAYPWYKGQVLDWEQDVPVWQARGGIVVGKIDFLREVLAAYGYDKPLMLTEAGLVCPKCSSPPSSEFLEAQAAYVPRLFVRNMALGLEATVWYTLDGPGWRQAQLLETKDEPRPAYYAYKTMVSLLDDTVYLRPVDEFAGLTGYAFQQPDGEVWVLWSPEDTSVSIPIPAGLQQVYDLMGVPQSIDGAELTIGFAPVYLELSSTP